MNFDRTALEVSGVVFGLSLLAIFLLYDIARFLLNPNWREFWGREFLGKLPSVPRRFPSNWAFPVSVGSGLLALSLVLGPARALVFDPVPHSLWLGFWGGLFWLALYGVATATLFPFGIRLFPGYASADAPGETGIPSAGEGQAELLVQPAPGKPMVQLLVALLLIFRGLFAACLIAYLILLSKSPPPQEVNSWWQPLNIFLMGSTMVIWISGGMPFASCFVGFLIYLTMSVPAEGKSWLGWPILVSFLGMWVVRGFPRKSVGEKTRAGPDVQEKAEPPRPRTRRMPGKGITVLVLIVGFFVAGYGSLLLVLSWSGQVEGLIWQAIPITFLGLVLLGLGIRSKFP